MPKLCVIGLGYVGIPVAAKFAEAGFDVVGIDLDGTKVEKINQGVFPLKGEEPGMKELVDKVVRGGKMKASLNYDECKNADFILISVQTPMKNNEPDYSFLKESLKSVGKRLKKGALVSIESTLSPKTMNSLVKPLLERESGMIAGKDFHLVHCPERVKTGKLLEFIEKTSRVIGAVNEESGERAKKIYGRIVMGNLDITDMITAEVTKTVENSYWDTQIAFANEMALICERLGVDFFKMRELVNKSPFRDMLMAGTGVGGHCIPKDPKLLVYSVSGYEPELIKISRKINDSMPFHMLELINKSITKGAKICIFGLAYTKNTEDMRNSPSLVIIDLLKKAGFDTCAYDPFVEGYSDFEGCLSGSDCLVLATDHTEFNKLNTKEGLEKIKKLMRNPSIVDGRNLFDRKLCEEMGFTYRGIGKG